MQVGTPDQLSLSVQRAIVRRADIVFLAEPAPTAPAVAPMPGLLNVTGIVDGGTVATPVTVPPIPLAVALRSADQGTDLDLRRRRLELQAKAIEMDTGHRPDEPRQPGVQERLLELRRRKIEWDREPVEARSYGQDFARDRYGNATYWHLHTNDCLAYRENVALGPSEGDSSCVQSHRQSQAGRAGHRIAAV
jgi:hypothetical protein